MRSSTSWASLSWRAQRTSPSPGCGTGGRSRARGLSPRPAGTSCRGFLLPLLRSSLLGTCLAEATSGFLEWQGRAGCLLEELCPGFAVGTASQRPVDSSRRPGVGTLQTAVWLPANVCPKLSSSRSSLLSSSSPSDVLMAQPASVPFPLAAHLPLLFLLPEPCPGEPSCLGWTAGLITLEAASASVSQLRLQPGRLQGQPP